MAVRKACGVDMGKKSFVASICDGRSFITREFVNSFQGYGEFKAWLKENKCRDVAVESTGVLWTQLYLSLEQSCFRVKLANPYHIKHRPGKKTDQKDSEWIAELLKNNQIEASYVPDKRIRDLRELTRTRVKLVQTRTDFKNRVHRVFERCSIKLSSVIHDLFGPAGREIVEGIIEGKDVKEILDYTSNKTLQKRKRMVENAVRGALSPNDILLLKHMVEVIKKLDEEIVKIEAEMTSLLDKEDMGIVSSVPGVGSKSAPLILAEIGDVNRFVSASKLSSWTGMAPSVYQSSGLVLTGHITRQGSKYLRYIMVEVAHSVSRMKHGRLASFYQRIKRKKGGQVALVALGRKILTIIWHLLKKREKYVEEGVDKKFKLRPYGEQKLPLKEMARILMSAGYIVMEQG
jgi:transposase